MNTKTITTIVMVVAIIILVAWDLFVNFNTVKGDTISETIANWIQSAPIIAVTLGVICGHFVGAWPSVETVLSYVSARPIIPFLFGCVNGFLFWNMSR